MGAEGSGLRRERTFRSHSEEQTEALAAALGARAPAGLVVALDGDLGSGKTCFVRGLARGLEAEGPVASPTYTLMHEYPGAVPLYHFDAWMQGREAAFLQGGGAEWLTAEGVAAVEWAERVEPWLPLPRLAVRLEHRGPSDRRIVIGVLAEGPEPALEALLAGLPDPETALRVGGEGRADPGESE